MTKLFNARTLGLTFAAAVAVATPAIAQPANAQAFDEPTSIAVSYADLDIGHAAGAKTLLRRIRAASATICGGPPDLRLMEERIAFDQCSDAIVAAAVAKVNSPMLTAIASHDLQPVRVAGR